MNDLERRQKGFRPMNSDKYAERPILKVLDVPEKTSHGSTMWHIGNLCRVMDYLGVGTIEHDYVKNLLEERLKEYETEQAGKE